MSAYFKSLSGDIISVSLSSLISPEGLDMWNPWNRIISIIATENDCDDYQVAIFDEEGEEKDHSHPPELIPEKKYNYLIRDSKDILFIFSINVKYEDGIFSICIEDHKFNVYEKEIEGNTVYYHENDMTNGLSSMYSILCEKADLPVIWYDRQNMIDRIMQRYQQIQDYRFEYDEGWDRFEYNE